MPRLGGRGLHLVLILTKYLLTNSSFFNKYEHDLTLTILLSHFDFRIATPCVFLTVVPHISSLVTIHLRRHSVLLTTAYAEWSP